MGSDDTILKPLANESSDPTIIHLDSERSTLVLGKLQKLLSTIQKVREDSSFRDSSSQSQKGSSQLKGGDEVQEHKDGTENVRVRQKDLEYSRKVYLAVLHSTVKLIDLGICDDRYLDWVTTFLTNFKLRKLQDQ
jgi:hypothetical protein